MQTSLNTLVLVLDFFGVGRIAFPYRAASIESTEL